MKRTILTFGLISGAVSSIMMVATVPFMHRIGFDHGYVIGYTSMVISFLLVYFGIRSYRDNVANGHITFGKAFTLGIAITAISCVCYVVTWEILYYNFLPDFWQNYTNYAVQKARAAGAADAQIQAKIAEMTRFQKMYQNPLINAAMTFIEPLPVGLIMTLISAGILRKRTPAGVPAAA